MKKTVLALLSVCIVASSCNKNNDLHQTPGYTHQFNDDFYDNQNNWAYSDPSTGTLVTIDGSYLTYKYYPQNPGSSTIAVQTNANLDGDFSAQTSIQTGNAMGLAMGVSNSDYGYAFMINNSGQFALYYEGYSGVQPQAIVAWQGSSAIKLNVLNNLEMDQVGNSWYGYINGTQVFQVPAQVFYGSKFGFIVDNGTTGYADYLTVQW